MSSPHCCVKNNCSGSKFNGLFLQCKHCHNKVFLECMCTIDSPILRIFGIVEEQPKGSKNFVAVDPIENKSTFDVFKNTFHSDGPFGISCDSCVKKLLYFIGEDTFSNSLEANNDCQKISLSTITSNDNNNQIRSPKQLRVPETRAPEPIRLPTSKSTAIDQGTHELLRIYVSKFHPETECIDLANHIWLKTSLVEKDDFSITKLTKKHHKWPLSFVSFMVTTTTKGAYDKIISSDVWDGFVASAFEPRDKSKKGHKKNAGKFEEKLNQKQPKQKLHIKNTSKKQHEPEPEPEKPKTKHRSEHKTTSKNDENQRKKKSKEKKEKTVAAKQKITSNPDFLELIKSQHLMLQLLLKQQQPQTSTFQQCNCRH